MKKILFLLLSILIINGCSLNSNIKEENQINEDRINYFNSDNFGFTFSYPSYLKVEVNQDNHQQLFIYPRKNDEPLTAIVMFEVTDDSIEASGAVTSSENINPNLIEDNTTKKQNNLVLLENRTVIKDPNNEREVRIGYLIEEDKGAKPLVKELEEIKNTIIFK